MHPMGQSVLENCFLLVFFFSRMNIWSVLTLTSVAFECLGLAVLQVCYIIHIG